MVFHKHHGISYSMVFQCKFANAYTLVLCAVMPERVQRGKAGGNGQEGRAYFLKVSPNYRIHITSNSSSNCRENFEGDGRATL